jgi:hypothetical protein
MSFHDIVRNMMGQAPAVWPMLTGWGNKLSTPKVAGLFTAGGLPMQPPACTPGLIPVSTATPEDPYNEPHEPREEPCEILFTFGSWQIECYKNTPNDFNECDWVSHYCPVYGWRYRIDQFELVQDGVCPECCEEVPEEVMGVWKLKNFDSLPNEGTCAVVNHSKVYATPTEKEEPEW